MTNAPTSPCDGAAIAAARRRLPMVEVEPETPAVLYEGLYEEASRYREYLGYPVPWYAAPPGSVDRLISDRYIGVLVCYLRDGDRVYETYWTSGRGDDAVVPSYGLLDRTVYGRQEVVASVGTGPTGWGTTTNNER